MSPTATDLPVKIQFIWTTIRGTHPADSVLLTGNGAETLLEFQNNTFTALSSQLKEWIENGSRSEVFEQFRLWAKATHATYVITYKRVIEYVDGPEFLKSVERTEEKIVAMMRAAELQGTFDATLDKLLNVLADYHESDRQLYFCKNSGGIRFDGSQETAPWVPGDGAAAMRARSLQVSADGLAKIEDGMMIKMRKRMGLGEDAES